MADKSKVVNEDAAISTSVELVQRFIPQNTQLNALMRKYAGVKSGAQVDPIDRAHLLHYHLLLINQSVDFKHLRKPWGKKIKQTYSTESGAVHAVASFLRKLTDSYNLEAAALIKTKKKREKLNGKKVVSTYYEVSSVALGRYGNVIAFALFGAFVGFFRSQKIMVHTHPYSEKDSRANHFSGIPGKILPSRVVLPYGDTTVVERLRYKSIYLVAPEGSLKKYDGIGETLHKARNVQQLTSIKPLLAAVPKPAVFYLVDPVTGKQFPVSTKD